ncbi:MAG: zinc-binding dehydrogenase [Microscillaceae bacterium]
MKSLVLQEDSQEKLVVKDSPRPALKEGEALVRIQAAALNHRDQWCRVGMYPGLRYPSILGSDGCGVVEEVAEGVDQAWLGQEVILNPNVNWGSDPEFQGYNYSILGMPTNGTLAEYIAVPAHRLHAKPSHLSAEEAAALPLAGLTAFRAVFRKGGVKSGDLVLITGIGGGVALFALQFCVAVGAKAYVSSGHEAKIEKALALGAAGGFLYKEEKWTKGLAKVAPLGFQAIIDGAGGPDFGEVAKMLAPAGNLVVYGTTAGNPSPIHIPRLFFSQANIKGSTMGNDQEFADMVAFVAAHEIKPIVSSVRPFAEAISAFDEMAAGGQFGKLVIRVSE